MRISYYGRAKCFESSTRKLLTNHSNFGREVGMKPSLGSTGIDQNLNSPIA